MYPSGEIRNPEPSPCTRSVYVRSPKNCLKKGSSPQGLLYRYCLTSVTLMPTTAGLTMATVLVIAFLREPPITSPRESRTSPSDDDIRASVKGAPGNGCPSPAPAAGGRPILYPITPPARRGRRRTIAMTAIFLFMICPLLLCHAGGNALSASLLCTPGPAPDVSRARRTSTRRQTR